MTNEARRNTGPAAWSLPVRSVATQLNLLAGLETQWVGNPTVDLRFVPTSAMNADRHLLREAPRLDLAIEGRATEAGAVQHRRQTDYPILLNGHARLSGSGLPAVCQSGPAVSARARLQAMSCRYSRYPLLIAATQSAQKTAGCAAWKEAIQ